jgi:hypothetical protein
MDWMTDQIAIGNYLDGSDVEGIEMVGIQAGVLFDGAGKGWRLAGETVGSG